MVNIYLPTQQAQAHLFLNALMVFLLGWLNNMIVKTSKGYVVKSMSGRNLSKPLPTKSQAQARLRTIEYYKSKK